MTDWVQSQVESYQRLKKWFLMLSCLTFSIIRYVSRVKWSNPGKGVAPSPATQCSSYWKGRLRVILDYGWQLYFFIYHHAREDKGVNSIWKRWLTIKWYWFQSQVESYQRLKKWYLMLSCLTFSIIRYVSRVKWSNPGKGVVPSPAPQCSSYWKGSLRVTLDYDWQLYFFIYQHAREDKGVNSIWKRWQTIK